MALAGWLIFVLEIYDGNSVFNQEPGAESSRALPSETFEARTEGISFDRQVFILWFENVLSHSVHTMNGNTEVMTQRIRIFDKEIRTKTDKR